MSDHSTDPEKSRVTFALRQVEDMLSLAVMDREWDLVSAAGMLLVGIRQLIDDTHLDDEPFDGRPSREDHLEEEREASEGFDGTVEMCAIAIISDVQKFPALWNWGDGHGGHVLRSVAESITRKAVDAGIDRPDPPRERPKRLTPIHKRLHRLAERDGWACKYCQSELTCACMDANDTPAISEHVLPKSRGGSDEDENLVLACSPCNSSKGDKTPSEWLGT